MSEGRFISYLRVSTARQGRSGLGIEAQREAVRHFVAARGGRLLEPEFVEVETGKRNTRPELLKALARCRSTGATLVVAKLDRLSRNAAFLLTLRDSGVGFIAADLPDANTMTLGVMASMAQHEAEVISSRTKAALKAAKARGVRLGGQRSGSARIARWQAKGVAAVVERATERLGDVADELRQLHASGLSLRGIAGQLNAAEIRSAAGSRWTAMGVKRALARLQG